MGVLLGRIELQAQRIRVEINNCNDEQFMRLLKNGGDAFYIIRNDYEKAYIRLVKETAIRTLRENPELLRKLEKKLLEDNCKKPMLYPQIHGDKELIEALSQFDSDIMRKSYITGTRNILYLAIYMLVERAREERE